MRKVSVLVAVALLLVVPAVALAGGPHGGHHGAGAHGAPCMHGGKPQGSYPGWGHPGPLGMLARLGLSEEQWEKVERIRAEARRERLELRKEVLKVRAELHREMLEDAPSMEKIRRMAERMAELRGKMQISRLRQQLEIRKVLTAEQRDRLVAMLGSKFASRASEGAPCGRRGHPEPSLGEAGPPQGPPRWWMSPPPWWHEDEHEDEDDD